MIARRSRPPAGRRGAALLAALCFALVLAITLASYITVCHRSLQMSTRNMNSARGAELAENGLEEALWSLNKSDWSGWTIAGTTASKTVTGFTYDGGATGAVALSVTDYAGPVGPRTVTVTGTTTLGDGTTTSRRLTAQATPAALFVNALAATTSTVTFSSAGTVDSYNSSLGTYASQTPTFSAIVASSAAATTSATVTLTNAQVKGYVASNYSGGPAVSSSGRVYGLTSPTSPKVDPARVSPSPYQPVFDILTVTGGTALSAPALNSSVTLGNSTDLTPVIYRYSSLDLRGSTKILINGPVRLVVSGTFYVGLNDSAGTASIEVATTGTLEVFAGGDIAIYAGGMNNLTRDPQRMIIYGTNALSVPDMNTTVAFYGVLYTPNGAFKVISNNAIYGALVARSLAFTGSAPVIHYDLNLRAVVLRGVDTPYAVSAWHEIAGP
jgi:hypothetical protein